MKKELSVYIHVPFCVQKCLYCDFISYPNRETAWLPYFDALRGEIEAWAYLLRDRICPSVFFGGGTPSLLPAELLSDALARLRRSMEFAEDAEITLEANPGTVTREGLRHLRQAGFNRVSFGVQAFDDGLLRTLGRIHRAEDAKSAIFMAREAGFENVNIDLMYALPNQDMTLWRDTLEQAIELQPEHISAYSLILEEGTPMYQAYEAGKIHIPEEDAVLQMQRTATALLREAGYYRYEISNYAKRGRECRHNTRYWTRGEYLGLGCAAHSLAEGKRFHNPTSLEEYLAGKRAEDAEYIHADGRAEELLMLSLRMARGLSLAQFHAEAGMDFSEYAPRAEQLARDGFAEFSDGFFALTEKGMEVQDAIVLKLLR